MTDTFAGISPQSVPLFVVGQVLGGASAALFARWLLSGYLIFSRFKWRLSWRIEISLKSFQEL
jgi:hypothetical protein